MVTSAEQTLVVSELYVETLGRFNVSVGGERLADTAWGREKARQLFQYLITYHRRFTIKERIFEDLWPELDPERAERDFKVALNALNDALQPARAPRSLAAYIGRQGSSYGLNPDAPIRLDVVEFEEGLASGSALENQHPDRAIASYQQALERYQGDYLPDTIYDDWTSLERERLTTLYLTGATRLARLLLDSGVTVEVVLWCQRAIAVDPCWEEAYRLLMRGHMADGNRPQALRVYDRCRAVLAQELGLEPMTETQRLHDQILSGRVDTL